MRRDLGDVIVQHLQAARPCYVPRTPVAETGGYLQRQLLADAQLPGCGPGIDTRKPGVGRQGLRDSRCNPTQQEVVGRRIYGEAKTAAVRNRQSRLTQDQAYGRIVEINAPSLEVFYDRVVVGCNVETQQGQFEAAFAVLGTVAAAGIAT